MKIFLSYAEEDGETAKSLHEQLIGQGFNVYRWQGERGKKFINQIEKKIEEADAFVALISESFVLSPWCRRERNMAFQREDPDNQFVYVVKVGHIDNKRAGLLGEYDWLDLTGPNKAEAIDNLFQRLQEKQSTSFKAVEIPVVVFAMTHDEAVDVAQNEILKSTELLGHFSTYQIRDLAEYYHDFRDDWHPVNGNNSSIQEIIEEIVDQLNLESSESKIWPRFYSEDFLSNEQNIRNKTHLWLAENGGILIIDTISLFHTRLREQLMGSACWNSRVSIVALHPIGMGALPTNGFIESIVNKLEKAFYRFDKVLDLYCDLGIGDMRDLKRWLSLALPATQKRFQTLQPDLDRLKSVKQVQPKLGNIRSLIRGDLGEAK